MIIQGLYRVLRYLPLRKRTRVFLWLRQWGIERRLQNEGEIVYDYDGCRIGVDLNDHVGREMFKHGWYESLYVNFIRARLGDPEAVFFDVGANIGNYCLALAPYFRQTLAFEPNPRSYDALLANCRRNPELVIRPLPVGLSARAETLEFHARTQDNSGESSFEPVSGRSETLRLQVMPGDACAPANQRVALVKIDVEGHELDVLQGLAATLARDRPTVCLEWHTRFMDSRGGVTRLRALLPENYAIVYCARRDRIDLKEFAPPYRRKYNLIFCVAESELHRLAGGAHLASQRAASLAK